jgi:hypothetical protein
VVDGRRVLEANKVEPTSAPASTCCCPKFLSNFLELGADLLKIFSRERPTANTSSVGLDYTYDSRDLPKIQSETRKDA